MSLKFFLLLLITNCFVFITNLNTEGVGVYRDV